MSSSFPQDIRQIMAVAPIKIALLFMVPRFSLCEHHRSTRNTRYPMIRVGSALRGDSTRSGAMLFHGSPVKQRIRNFGGLPIL
jgi:hypothetical protein